MQVAALRDHGAGRPKRVAAVLLLAASLAPLPACTAPARLRSETRYDYGAVFLLPGIEGQSAWTRDVAIGLEDGGVSSAIEIYDWTTGLPGGFLFNLMDIERNRRQAKLLVDHIIAYQDEHPGRPVHVIGYSGGGGVAVLAVEALPPEHPIDMLLLVAPALTPEYNLTAALRNTRMGVCNFYSTRDTVILGIGTSTFGTIDRAFGVSAGKVGFRTPGVLEESDRLLYDSRLRQVGWSPRIQKKYGVSGSHLSWLSRRFACGYLAELIVENEAASAINASAE